jgi:hypothetical protein
MQECVTLSVIKTELVTVTNCIQEKLYDCNFIESMAVKVKIPMGMEVD